jgi:hypothetical protein
MFRYRMFQLKQPMGDTDVTQESGVRHPMLLVGLAAGYNSRAYV